MPPKVPDMCPDIILLSKAEWKAEGARLFGPDLFQWRFVCPSCGNVATPADFRQYRDRGAQAESATSECIGRYTGAQTAFDPKVKPCNYAGYGLFRLSPVRVVDEDGEQFHCFGFAEPVQSANRSEPQPTNPSPEERRRKTKPGTF